MARHAQMACKVNLAPITGGAQGSKMVFHIGFMLGLHYIM
jgi:hypothetical protein